MWGSVALADETADFQQARNAYLKKDYGEATSRFEEMLDPTKGTLKTKEVIDEAQFCYGAVKFAVGERENAHKLWDKVLSDTKGTYTADSFTYSSEVINDFITEKQRWKNELLQHEQAQAEIDAAQRAKEAAERARLEARVKDLETLLSLETVVVQNSRETALLPFGIGQFQNGQKLLGWIFLSTEIAGVLGTCALFIPYRYYIDQYNAARTGPGSPQYRQELANEAAAVAQNIRTADFIILGALGAIMITGIFQAEIAFKPTVTYTRKRTVSGVWPSFAPLPNGAALGLHGTF
jgi:hypothetical protein